MTAYRVTYVSCAEAILTPFGHLPRDLTSVPGLKMRYRPDLGVIEFKKDTWDGRSVCVARERFSSFELDETVELKVEATPKGGAKPAK